jgi:hypothetical protein
MGKHGLFYYGRSEQDGEMGREGLNEYMTGNRMLIFNHIYKKRTTTRDVIF